MIGMSSLLPDSCPDLDILIFIVASTMIRANGDRQILCRA